LRGQRNTYNISPGSRNAPLTIGFASNPTFTSYSIADERSAAFALGIAQQTKTLLRWFVPLVQHF
jgi:2-succinyl-5-enolpyruvyl-6-hydroxy-3-cyclohexene-1-carboxylate synthase